jgi:hypothetical protein
MHGNARHHGFSRVSRRVSGFVRLEVPTGLPSTKSVMSLRFLPTWSAAADFSIAGSEYVELHDARRGVSVRLSQQVSEVRWDKDGTKAEWRILYKGRWVAPEPRPLPGATAKAWRDFGCKIGWMGPSIKYGQVYFESKFDAKSMDAASTVPGIIVGYGDADFQKLKTVTAPKFPLRSGFTISHSKIKTSRCSHASRTLKSCS